METKNVIKIIFSSLLIFFNGIILGQKKETVYLLLNSVQDDQKIVFNKNNTIEFYLDKEYFINRNEKEKRDTLDISFISSIKTMSIKELKLKETNILKQKAKEIRKKYNIPFPTKTLYHDLFDVYIIKKINENCIVKYEVTWLHYID